MADTVVRCPKCNERAVLMQDERNEDLWYVCHDCKWCGRQTEVWSRAVGYLRPVQGWNNGKRQEFTERKTYKINK